MKFSLFILTSYTINRTATQSTKKRINTRYPGGLGNLAIMLIWYHLEHIIQVASHDDTIFPVGGEMEAGLRISCRHSSFVVGVLLKSPSLDLSYPKNVAKFG